MLTIVYLIASVAGAALVLGLVSARVDLVCRSPLAARPMHVAVSAEAALAFAAALSASTACALTLARTLAL